MHGALHLWGKTLRQRGDMLIGIAHPQFRAELAREIREIQHLDLVLDSNSTMEQLD